MNEKKRQKNVLARLYNFINVTQCRKLSSKQITFLFRTFTINYCICYEAVLEDPKSSDYFLTNEYNER